MRGASSSVPTARCSRLICSLSASDSSAAEVARDRRASLAAVAAAVYTAYLFAQAKARDLWQSPLLAAAPARAGAARRRGGAAAARRTGSRPRPSRRSSGCSRRRARPSRRWSAGEVSVPHPTAHARLAAHELTRGRYRAAASGGRGARRRGARRAAARRRRRAARARSACSRTSTPTSRPASRCRSPEEAMTMTLQRAVSCRAEA